MQGAGRGWGRESEERQEAGSRAHQFPAHAHPVVVVVVGRYARPAMHWARLDLAGLD